MMNLLNKYLAKVNSDNQKHVMREFLQTQILKAIYASKYNTSIIFMGGTCLRICFDIPRFSEDLDFNLAQKNLNFLDLLNYLQQQLKKLGFNVDVVGKSNKIVYKGFIRFSDLLYKFKISPNRSEKLSIKLEIDSKPQKNYHSETNIISKFGFSFIMKNTNLPSMMAGKIHACFFRGYYKGRDFYDLIWYLSKKITPNYKLLQEFKVNVKNKQELINYLNQQIKNIDLPKIVQDAYQFLENKSEIEILKNFKTIFPKITQKYLF